MDLLVWVCWEVKTRYFVFNYTKLLTPKSETLPIGVLFFFLNYSVNLDVFFFTTSIKPLLLLF